MDTEFQPSQYVSRAGQKLRHALDAFGLSVNGLVCADFGCSTGGFVDCLLQAGASKVYAVDTAYGVLDWKLRNDGRVVVLERTNALHVELPELMDCIVIDAGWTRQQLIIPRALVNLKPEGFIVTLVKPHYEAEKDWLEAGKVKEEYLPHVLAKVKSEMAALGVTIAGETTSPIVGGKGGNVEYLLWLKR